MGNSFSLEDSVYLRGDLPKSNFFFKNLIFFILGIIIILFFFCFSFLSAPSDFPKGAIVNIAVGENLRSVSLQLKNAHIIRSRVAFEAFIILYGGEKHIISADYLFENKLPVYEVARRIAKGERHLAPIKVTIPEGFNISDIVQVFSSKLSHFNKAQFLLKAKDKEGYLFPDTYFFFSISNEDDALKAFAINYEKKIAPLRPEILANRKTEREIITMASIIEKEAKGDADRTLISGILWKRLSINMLLQVDAAPSTYKISGLPKSPIANPGLSSIIAAIHPISSNYLYYLHDKEGVVHFAVTYAEHIKNRNKYLK